jgi:hypothetical protein
MNAVNSELDNMSASELKICIRELARKLPEKDRSHFLSTISNNKYNPKKKTANSRKNLNKEIDNIIAKLRDINNGERSLTSEYNEEWDDWYNSDVEEIFFSDPHKLLPDIVKAINLLNKCVNKELYDKGYDLAQDLSHLAVTANGDWSDFNGDSLRLKDLYDNNLVTGSFSLVVTESLYLTYMASEPADRAKELYYMLCDYNCDDIKLEAVMQMGKSSLPDFDLFLPDWIALLGKCTDWRTKRLLEEAMSMIQDDFQALIVARDHAENHPELYKQILESGKSQNDPTRLYKIGLEALEKIPVKLKIRSEIALLTADYSCMMNNSYGAEKCWMEAFESDSSVVNYLRLRFLSKKWDDYSWRVGKIIDIEYHKTMSMKDIPGGYYRNNFLGENTLYKNDHCTILFWEKRFDEVIKLGLSEKKMLGWSDTFMKQGLALFLLLLYEGDIYKADLYSMFRLAIYECGFDSKEFYKGTDIEALKDNYSLFVELFDKWRTEVSVPEEDKKIWISNIQMLIAQRADAIMEANKRNYYNECAAFIAACGEVMESRGQKGVKQSLMLSYKKEYSRRRAFIQELRNYGFRG